ncbi:MAG: Gfo/Idh/MocA family protein, partial [Pirellulaceae bacterium]
MMTADRRTSAPTSASPPTPTPPPRPANYSRRKFLGRVGQVSMALAVPIVIPGSALGLNGTLAPSNRTTLGAIGIRGRGREDLTHFLNNRDVQFLAICDVQKVQRETVKQVADSHYGNQDCAMYADLHEMLARPDMDAVLIATGDRWHTMASIIAAKAGKDVYCEKPCSMTISESRALADAYRKYDCIYQAGTQRRSIGNFIFAAELIARGKLGKLHTVHANTLAPATSHQWLPEQPLPSKDECDWNLWLGPCPWRPYNQQYITGGW